LFEEFKKRNQENGKDAPVIYLHEGDRWLYEHIDIQAGMLGLPPFDVEKDFTKIEHGQNYKGFGGARAIHTPGHTPGSCCLCVDADSNITAPRSYMRGFQGVAENIVFTGDTLFRGSVGRTDLWGGDSELIFKSIKSRLVTLADKRDDVLVIPGHGPMTSIQNEKSSNPFLKEL